MKQLDRFHNTTLIGARFAQPGAMIDQEKQIEILM
jgi:hypothetical protein